MHSVMVTQPLLSALNVLEPYPWAAHVELILRHTWGSELPRMQLLAEELHGGAATMRRSGFSVRLFEATHRTISITMPGFAALHGSARSASPFEAPWNLLLPSVATDKFTMVPVTVVDDVSDGEVGEFSFFMPDADRTVTLKEALSGCHFLSSAILSSRQSQGDIRALPAWRVVRDWLTSMHGLLVDMVDTHRLIERAAEELKRKRVDVLQAVYPSAHRVFGSEASKRPLSQGMLCSAIHPDDQEVIRTTYDKAAAGRSVPLAEQLFNYPQLYYDEEG